MRLSYLAWGCGLLLFAACTDSAGPLSRPCGDSVGSSPLGVRTAPASEGRGIWIIDRATAEPITGQALVVRSRGGEFELTTDSAGWASWPDEITDEDSIDLITAWDWEGDRSLEKVETSWLGLAAGCIAVESNFPSRASGSLSLPSKRPKTVQGKLRIEVGGLSQPGQYVLSHISYSQSSATRQLFSVDAPEVDIDVEFFRDRSNGFEVFALAEGDEVAADDWSNVFGWAGAEVIVSEDAEDGDVLATLTLAPIVQDFLTLQLPANVLGTIDGQETAVSSFKQGGIGFGGPSVSLSSDETEVSIAMPDPSVARVDSFSLSLRSANEEVYRTAETEPLGDRVFVAYPLMNARTPTFDEGVDLGPRDANANLTIFSALGTTSPNGERTSFYVFILDDRSRVDTTTRLARMLANEDYSIALQDVHFAETPDPNNLGGPLPNRLGYVTRLIGWN